MASSAIEAMLTAAVAAEARPRPPSSREFREWLDFARQHAPHIHPFQSDVSRISCSCLWWAREQGVLFYNVVVRTIGEASQSVVS